jgi:RNA polymerase sigma-70 factor, ECF subfamily
MAIHSKILQAIFSPAQLIDWEMVYQAELPRVYNFFLYKTGDRQQAQDLTASSFERAWKHRSSYRPEQSSPSTWLFGIARNVLKEHLRVLPDHKSRYVSILEADPRVTGVDVEMRVQQEQDRERLRRVILELPEREQDLIAMKYGTPLTPFSSSSTRSASVPSISSPARSLSRSAS